MANLRCYVEFGFNNINLCVMYTVPQITLWASITVTIQYGWLPVLYHFLFVILFSVIYYLFILFYLLVFSYCYC